MITKLVKVNRKISKRKSREVKILFKSNTQRKNYYKNIKKKQKSNKAEKWKSINKKNKK